MVIYLVGFLFSMPVALTSYINSSFLEEFMNPTFVSSVYVIASILTLIGILEMPKILIHKGNKFAIILLSLITALTLGVLAFAKSSAFIIPAFIVFFVSTSLIFTSLDIFLEDLSGKAPVGKLRGLYLTSINLAWMIAQTISGSIIAKSSFSGIYLLSGFFTLLVPVAIWLLLKDFKDPDYKKISIRKTVIFFIRNKNMSKIYLTNLILRFFFVWMIIYTPIYLHDYIGLPWDKIGFIFTIMLLPFVLLDFPLGRLSDKIGEKEILGVGFIVAAISTFFLPLISAPIVWMFALVLFFTRVGASSIEVMSESYFFKLIDEENIEAIGFFRNTRAVGFIIAPLIAIVILALVPSFKFIFPVLSIILLFGFLLVQGIEDTR